MTLIKVLEEYKSRYGEIRLKTPSGLPLDYWSTSLEEERHSNFIL